MRTTLTGLVGVLILVVSASTSRAESDRIALRIARGAVHEKLDLLLSEVDPSKDQRRQLKALRRSQEKILEGSGDVPSDVRAARSAVKKLARGPEHDPAMTEMLVGVTWLLIEDSEVWLAGIRAQLEAGAMSLSPRKRARALRKIQKSRKHVAAARAVLTNNENITEWKLSHVKRSLKKLNGAVQYSVYADYEDPPCDGKKRTADEWASITVSTLPSAPGGAKQVLVGDLDHGSAARSDGTAGRALTILLPMCGRTGTVRTYRITVRANAGESFVGLYEAGEPDGDAVVAVFGAYLDVMYVSSVVATVTIDAYEETFEPHPPDGLVSGNVKVLGSQGSGTLEQVIAFRLRVKD